MVLGIGDGKLDINMNGSTFSPGQKISGTIILNLNQPKKARGLRIEFYGEIRRRRGKHTHIERIFQVTQQLASEKTYNNGETYSFELAVPAGIDFKVPEGILGSIMNFMMPRPTFYVHATLDAPMELDINKRVIVNITNGLVNIQKVESPKTVQEALDLTKQNMDASQKIT